MSVPRYAYAVLLACAALVAVEIAARHAMDLKYYGSDSEVGFWLLPNQSGGSLLVDTFEINAAGFNVGERYSLAGENDIILVGDSLVAGPGIDHNNKLGPVLEKVAGLQVWPLSTGGWALTNELRALERKSIDGAEAIVFLLNAGDLGQPAEWTSDYDLPRARPAIYLLYALQKEFPIFRRPVRSLPVRRGNVEAEWRDFRSRVKAPVFIIGYESVATTGQKCQWIPEWISDPAFCFDPIERGEGNLMKDSIHLTEEGTARLAAFIATKVDLSGVP